MRRKRIRGFEISDESISLLIAALEKKLEETEERAGLYLEKWGMASDFIKSNDDVEKFVEFVYMENKKGLKLFESKELVAYFHEETMDLSTIECCKDDFNPWRD
jgi:hypothetical protein